MIELKSALISSNEENKNKIDVVFDKGLNIITYERKTLFDFFSLQYQSLDEGEFILDGKTFFPRTDDSQRLIVLLIKSKVFVVTTCFVMAKDDKDSFKQLQNQLASLRDLPLSDEEQKTFKIRRIMEIIADYHPGYLTIDKNDSVNTAHEKLIEKIVKKYAKEIVFLLLDKKPVSAIKEKAPDPVEDVVVEEGDACFVHINIGQGKIQRIEPEKKVFSAQNWELYKKVFNVNKISYLIAIVSILFSVLFMAIAPHYLITGDVFMGVFLIASCLLFIVIAYLVALSSFDFMDNPLKNSKIRRSISLIYSEIVVVIAAGLAIGAFFLLGTDNFLFDLSTYQYVNALPAAAIAVIHIIIPFFVSPLRKFNQWVKKLFQKRNK